MALEGDDVALAPAVGAPLVVGHGGGKLASRWNTRMEQVLIRTLRAVFLRAEAWAIAGLPEGAHQSIV